MLAAYLRPTNDDQKKNREAKSGDTGEPERPDATETAGLGPLTSKAFREKVQLALHVLDPRVARWWKAPSVAGYVRARDATSWHAAWRFNAFSQMNGDQPIITVDMHFTAGETAQAIIREVADGWFADSIGAYYRKYKFATSDAIEEFRKWQLGAATEAARLASVMAELYYNSLASLTPGGDLVVTINDLSEDQPWWQKLISILPLLGHLPVGTIVLKLGKRTIEVPKALVRKFESLGAKERSELIKRARSAATDGDARTIIERGLENVKAVPDHHIATNKNWVSSLRGGPWSPQFEKLFKKAGMTLEDAANKIKLPGHHGPHPEQYHREIFRRLTDATGRKDGAEYKSALLKELEVIAKEVETPGTLLNKLLTS